MATTSSVQTYQHNTLREGLTDVITMISPDETPFLSNFGRTKASNTLHEWSVDTLAAPAANAQVQGDEFTFTRKSVPLRKNNRTQIFRNDFEVAGTVQASNPAGYPDEVGRQKMKMTKSHALDIERALVQGTLAAGTTSTAATLAGVVASITTNAVAGVASETKVVREGKIQSLFKKIWDECGAEGDYTIYINGNQAETFAGMKGVATEISSVASEMQVTSAVEVFKTPFGIFRLKLHRWLPDGTAVVINHDYWKTAWLRETFQPEVAKTGDSERGVIISELTLEARAEAANAKATGLNLAVT